MFSDDKRCHMKQKIPHYTFLSDDLEFGETTWRVISLLLPTC